MQVLVFMLLPVFVFLGLFAYHEQTFFQVAEMWGGGRKNARDIIYMPFHNDKG